MRNGSRARDDPLGDVGGRSSVVGAVFEQDRELVAAQPRGRVGRRRSEEPFGDVAEELVAGGVAEAVVDRLEVVQVEEEHRDRLDGRAAAVERVRYAIPEERAVRQSGERVVERLVAQLLLELLALADVAGVEDDARARSGRAAGSCAGSPRR